ncbi:hypothetical protein ACIRP7_13915 [Streptomyces sp. NPDC102270]|uniref:hypothetical protein n=1 Tax=Streptomyces sp. NPDC102270 TaxID=3366150 RepID=UPI0038105F65
MASKPLTTRVSPAVHEALTALAARRGMSLAATASDLLSAAVADEDGTPPPPDGELTVAVLRALEEVTAPAAVLHREVALQMSRLIERGGRGATGAARRLMEAADRAIHLQERADRPVDPAMSALLADLFPGL